MANSAFGASSVSRIQPQMAGETGRSEASDGNWVQLNNEARTNSAPADNVDRRRTVRNAEREAKRVEQSGNTTLRALEDRINSKKGAETLADEIDGKTRRTRTKKEEISIERTLKEIRRRKPTKMKVVGLKAGSKKVVVSKTGQQLEAQISNSEKMRVLNAQDGSKVLVLNSDLSNSEVVVETAKVVSKDIGEIAKANNVEVAPDFLGRFLTSTKALIQHYLNVDLTANSSTELTSQLEEKQEDRLAIENARNKQLVTMQTNLRPKHLRD